MTSGAGSSWARGHAGGSFDCPFSHTGLHCSPFPSRGGGSASLPALLAWPKAAVLHDASPESSSGTCLPPPHETTSSLGRSTLEAVPAAGTPSAGSWGGVGALNGTSRCQSQPGAPALLLQPCLRQPPPRAASSDEQPPSSWRRGRGTACLILMWGRKRSGSGLTSSLLSITFPQG